MWYVGHIGEMGFDDAMFLRVFAVVVTPVKAGVILAVAVPGLKYVDLAIAGPDEGVCG